MDPLPLFFEHVFPKEFDAPVIDFNSAPGMGFHQLGEIGFKFLAGNLIWAAIKMIP